MRDLNTLKTHWTQLEESGMPTVEFESHAQIYGVTGYQTMLSKAITNNDSQIAEFLIRQGIDVHARFENEGTAFLFECIKGQFDTFKFLLENGAHPDKGKPWIVPIGAAARKGFLHIVRILIEKGADANGGARRVSSLSDGASFSPIEEACRRGDTPMAVALLEAGADANDGCFLPLERALEVGTLKLVEVLLAYGASADRASIMYRRHLRRRARDGSSSWSWWEFPEASEKLILLEACSSGGNDGSSLPSCKRLSNHPSIGNSPAPGIHHE